MAWSRCAWEAGWVRRESSKKSELQRSRIMTTTTAPESTSIVRGGEWLLQSADAGSVFTPERLTEEHRLIARTSREFVDNEVLPVLDRLEQKDWDLARKLVERGSELGLLGVDVPEAYGGLALDKISSLVISEQMAQSA